MSQKCQQCGVTNSQIALLSLHLTIALLNENYGCYNQIVLNKVFDYTKVKGIEKMSFIPLFFIDNKTQYLKQINKIGDENKFYI